MTLMKDYLEKAMKGVVLSEEKTIDLIYKHLMMVPDFKKLSMDRQGEISMKVLKMIQGKD
jgi:hypothetical protein